MRNKNLPKNLLAFWVVYWVVIIFSKYYYLDLMTTMFIVCPYIFSVLIVFLIIHKILNYKVRNYYFFPTLILYIVSTAIVVYVMSHAFDNLMNIG